jgi:hypothetical protein
MPENDIDILENDILEKYPNVLETLLRDHTTQKNIFWATDNYVELGKDYHFRNEILPEQITGQNGNVIMPRVKKDKIMQQSRSRNMAEVFTPSWICNAQNNLVDNIWFGTEYIFNTEIKNDDGTISWRTNDKKIEFPKGKTWKNYVTANRMEISCGEAPYITSRYDTTSGNFIELQNRIGLLDRKLRVVNENIHESGEWLKATQDAYKSIYAYEWQGDNLLLAREAMLITFIENYRFKFNKEPLLSSINFIAYIISWNVWQMDGLKGVIPNTCEIKTTNAHQLFGDNLSIEDKCKGCSNNIFKDHNGIKCIIKDWKVKDAITGKFGKKIEFITLINAQ